MENMVKLKEEFDYKSLSKRLEVQLDSLIEENERQQKAFVDEIERITVEAHNQISEAEKRYANALEVRDGTEPCLSWCMDSVIIYVVCRRKSKGIRMITWNQ